MAKNPFEGILQLSKQPTEKEPWGEMSCIGNEKIFSNEIVDGFDNIPMLLESDSPIFFRGQSNADWTLKPKLYRLWSSVITQYQQNSQEILKEALIKEYDSIRYFQQRAQRHLEITNTIPRKLSNDTFGEWLALMQHYNTPTRLLDWTASFRVALYFAVQDDLVNGAVWVFDKENFKKAAKEIYHEISPDQGDMILKDLDNFVEFGMNASHMILIYENDIKTDRIISQRGVFTFSTHIFTNHAFHIGQMLRGLQRFPLTKIIIPKHIKKDVRERLAKMNITNETLFVSIDSIGKTVEEKIQLYQDGILIPRLQENKVEI
jgi:hypothetical protein